VSGGGAKAGGSATSILVDCRTVTRVQAVGSNKKCSKTGCTPYPELVSNACFSVCPLPEGGTGEPPCVSISNRIADLSFLASLVPKHGAVPDHCLLLVNAGQRFFVDLVIILTTDNGIENASFHPARQLFFRKNMQLCF
jgi:hypothetical protein